MSARGVRIVVGEGPSTRKGLLRFVVDGEGYDVVAEASTTAELARLMATHRPDVVVLDDGIGATAVGMINEMSPNTKVVLVWPGAVMPIGGAARVEPARVLQDLGPTIERLTGQQSATTAGRGPALIESATSDPDMLNAMLLGGMATSGEAIIEDREPAPVVILPLTPTIDHDELILNVPDAEPDDEHVGAGAAAGVVAGGGGRSGTRRFRARRGLRERRLGRGRHVDRRSWRRGGCPERAEPPAGEPRTERRGGRERDRVGARAQRHPRDDRWHRRADGLTHPHRLSGPRIRGHPRFRRGAWW